MTAAALAGAAVVTVASTPGIEQTANSAMQVDINTFLAVMAMVISVGTILWKMSADSAQRKAFENYSTQRDVERRAYEARFDADRQKYREDFEKSVEARFAAMTSTTTLLRENISELRERLVGNYMTKPEIAAIETRVTNGQDRIFAAIERIDTRLNAISERLGGVKAHD